uniref:Pseudo-response regulator 37 homologue n=1 Tax=Lemna gibba TaxID=4470 RepID=Q2PEF4_LEMGI|nr:pseudo-response regulator 37 homologue [Lemna gibba]
MQDGEDYTVDRNVVGEKHQRSGDYESRINEPTEGLNESLECEVENSVCQQQKNSPLPPPLPPITSIGWERFLPVKSLKVLLVENDDSTRHVVNALLRNCSYEVTAVANGLEAWKFLENLSNNVDIVLTEVVMPSLTGIGLLDKIMSHMTLKTIPVIMMSSHDSMGIVFKCLSKGAVDFLVKPIRKNELKNLWQHVWRRCHSSSGSGSESGVQTQKSIKSKRFDSDDNDRRSDNDSMDYDEKNGSDNGSGAQSSWTKHAPESPQPPAPGDHLAEAPDSTCAQVIHLKPGPFSKDYFRSSSECSKQKDQCDDDMHEKDSKIKIHHSDGDRNNPSGEITAKAADLIATMSVQASNSLHRFTDKDTIINEDSQSFELSLKRLRSIGGDGVGCTDDRYVLRRSDLSAFSRYNTSTASGRNPYNMPKGDSDFNTTCIPAVTHEVGPTREVIMKSTVLNENESSSVVHPTHNKLREKIDLPSNLPCDRNQMAPKKIASVAKPCGSSNMDNGLADTNLGNYSMNVSISGSHHGSNAPNGRTNIESENGLTEKTEAAGCNGSGTGSGSGMDESRFAQRVAALTKFRQKRKQRCFQKKVRYQSRKKLAEQRPRIRGQFAKHTAHNHADHEADD